MDSESLDTPLMQLPLAQMRLAHALYRDTAAGAEQHLGETMSSLSEMLGVRQNALTQAADRLVNHGLAERVGDARDRRVVRLRLTAQGQAWVAERRDRRRERLLRMWEALSPDERAAFYGAVRTLEAAADRLGMAEGRNGAAPTCPGDGSIRAGAPSVEEMIEQLKADTATVSSAPVPAG